MPLYALAGKAQVSQTSPKTAGKRRRAESFSVGQFVTHTRIKPTMSFEGQCLFRPESSLPLSSPPRTTSSQTFSFSPPPSSWISSTKTSSAPADSQHSSERATKHNGLYDLPATKRRRGRRRRTRLSTEVDSHASYLEPLATKRSQLQPTTKATTLLSLLSAATLLLLLTATTTKLAEANNQQQQQQQQPNPLTFSSNQSPSSASPLRTVPIDSLDGATIGRSRTQLRSHISASSANKLNRKQQAASSSEAAASVATDNRNGLVNVKRRDNGISYTSFDNLLGSSAAATLASTGSRDESDEFDSDTDSKAAANLIRRLLASQLANLLASDSTTTATTSYSPAHKGPHMRHAFTLVDKSKPEVAHVRNDEATELHKKDQTQAVVVSSQRASPLTWLFGDSSDFGSSQQVGGDGGDGGGGGSGSDLVQPIASDIVGEITGASASQSQQQSFGATAAGTNVVGAVDETVTCSPDYEDQAIIEASGSNLTAEQQQQLLAGADSSGLLLANGSGAAADPFEPGKAGLATQTGTIAGGQAAFNGNAAGSRQTTMNGGNINGGQAIGQCVSPGNRMIEVITKIITPILFSIIIVVGLLGNIIVMLVILEDRKTERELTPTNLLILDLSLADLSFIIFCIPFTGWDYAIGHWVFGSLWCKFNQYLIVVCALSSIYTLVLMSIDRFLAIVYPIECMSYRTSKNMLYAIYIKWIIILIAASPTILMHGLIDSPLGPDQFNCRFLADQHNPLHFQIVFFITSYLFPLILIFCLYLSLLNKLWFGSKPRGHRESVKMLESKKKVTWLVASIVIVFALCWCPIQVMLILMRLKSHKITATYVAIQVFAHTLGYTNSCVNPIVYAFASETFHQSFKRSWLGRICLFCSRSTSTTTAMTNNNTQNNLSYYHTTTIMPRNSQNAYMHQLHQQQRQQQQQQLNPTNNNKLTLNRALDPSNRSARTSCDDLHSDYLPTCTQQNQQICSKKNYNGNQNSNQTTGKFDSSQNNSSGKVQVATNATATTTTTTTTAKRQQQLQQPQSTPSTAPENIVQQHTNCYSNNITSSATVTTSSLNGNNNNNNDNNNSNNDNNSNSSNLKGGSQSQNASQYSCSNNNDNQITSNSCDCCNQATTATECSDTGGCCCSIAVAAIGTQQQVHLRSLQDPSTTSNGTSCECAFIGHTDFETSSCCKPYVAANSSQTHQTQVSSISPTDHSQPNLFQSSSSSRSPVTAIGARQTAALIPRQPTTTTNPIVGLVQQQQQQQQHATTTTSTTPQLPAKQQLVARIYNSGTQVAHQCEPCDLQQQQQQLEGTSNE